MGLEACDDGNLVPGDGCEGNCTYTVVNEVVGAGGTATTDPLNNGPSAQIPVVTSVTSPNAGTVTIESTTAPTGADLEVVGTQLVIEAPAATAAAPLVLVLKINAASIPSGVVPSRLEILRNGVAVADCNPGMGDPPATPDPCVFSRVVGMDGSVTITIYTSQLSTWGVVVRGLDKDERTCANGIGKLANAVAKAQAKISQSCLKEAAAGDEPNAETCLSADAGGKLAAAMAKTTAFAGTDCNPAPVFAYAGPTTSNSAAQDEVVALVHDLFGANLTSAVVPASNKAAAKCQKAALSQANKLFGAIAKAFLGCAKDGLAGDPSLFVSGTELQSCFDQVDGGVNAKVGKAINKLASTLQGACVDVDVATTFPGSCASGAFAACVDTRVQCRACRFLNGALDLSEDCDVFDDGAANTSCP